jgi:hypothetical protein
VLMMSTKTRRGAGSSKARAARGSWRWAPSMRTRGGWGRWGGARASQARRKRKAGEALLFAPPLRAPRVSPPTPDGPGPKSSPVREGTARASRVLAQSLGKGVACAARRRGKGGGGEKQSRGRASLGGAMYNLVVERKGGVCVWGRRGRERRRVGRRRERRGSV